MGTFRFTKTFFTLVLSGAIALAPLTTQASQSGSTGAGSNTSGSGSNMAQLASMLMGAMGAMNLAQGMQKMQCCQTSSCDAGSGAKAAGDNAAGKAFSVKAAGDVSRHHQLPQPVREIKLDPKKQNKQEQEWNKLKGIAPANLANNCTNKSLLKDFSSWKLFAPSTAEAAGCTEAMMQMAQAAAMLAQALMGMMAAQKAKNDSNTGADNTANMSNISGPPATENLGAKDGSGASGIKIDPALLRQGNADSVMGNMEKTFGIPRDDFAKALADGASLKDIFAGAPKNAIPGGAFDKAVAQGNSLSASQQAGLIDQAGAGNIGRDLASDFAVNTAGSGTKSSSKSSARDTSMDDLAAQLKAMEGDGAKTMDNVALSPEVKAALEQREREQRAAGMTGMNIFQVVHSKYQEKIKMIFGSGNTKSGVADANGLVQQN